MSKPVNTKSTANVRHTYELLLNHHRVSLCSADAALRQAMQDLQGAPAQPAAACVGA